jgi:hypothetical protein
MSGWEMGGRQATKLRKSSARSAALPPCFLRGDPAFLTPEMTAARAALKHDPQVVEVIQTFWMNFALSPHNEAGREEYCRVYMLIARSMLAVFDTSDACDAAEAAYRAHSAHADGVTFAAFHSFLGRERGRLRELHLEAARARDLAHQPPRPAPHGLPHEPGRGGCRGHNRHFGGPRLPRGGQLG